MEDFAAVEDVLLAQHLLMLRTGVDVDLLLLGVDIPHQAGADVAFLQEAKFDPAWPNAVMERHQIDDARRWGSAVVAGELRLEPVAAAKPRWAKNPIDLHQTFPGSVAVATAEDRTGRTLTFVSVYTVNYENWAQTILQKQISDLTYLVKSPLGKNLMLGGDFNGRWYGHSH